MGVWSVERHRARSASAEARSFEQRLRRDIQGTELAGEIEAIGALGLNGQWAATAASFDRRGFQAGMGHSF